MLQLAEYRNTRLLLMGVKDVDSEDWEKEILGSDTLVLVDFWHERCPWCKRLDPVFYEVAEEYGDKVKFAKLNVLSSHQNNHLAAENGVMGTPTLVFYSDGRQIGTAVGFQPKDRLKQLVDEMLEKHKQCASQSTKTQNRLTP
jgi:thioredoxin 1